MRFFDARVFKALAEMLQVNCTLEYLQIDMCESLVKGYRLKLKRTRGRQIARNGICRASRYAFLSVLKHTSNAAQSTAEPQRKRLRHTSAKGFRRENLLDHGVILSIFAFAAESSTREIDVWSSRLD